MITIQESGLTFGPFVPDSIFRVERSPCVARLSGIKACEFAWWSADDGKLIFIEAKSTIPSAKNSPQEYEQYFSDMLEKFDNSLQLLLAGGWIRHTDLAAELSKLIPDLDWQQAEILFYLVVPKAPREYLGALTDKLTQILGRQLKIWRARAFVINEQMARDKGLLA
ncbi:hypothetical protein ACU6RQ_09000 [Zobellella denitrificans]